MTDSLTPELQSKVDSVVARLQEASALYEGSLVLANSLGAEDMLLADLIDRHALSIPQFVLDTGRLPEETLTLLATMTKRYVASKIDVFYPDAASVEVYVRESGINGFYESQALRKQCCAVRKLEPLARALKSRKAWITGLRREQSVTRDAVEFSEWDAGNGLQKLNPLADWKESEVWAYLRFFEVPYNELHDRHYPSIGCAPCTRAISVGEDLRAGRWWWENPENRECGLHAASSLIPLKPR